MLQTAVEDSEGEGVACEDENSERKTRCEGRRMGVLARGPVRIT